MILLSLLFAEFIEVVIITKRVLMLIMTIIRNKTIRSSSNSIKCC